MSENREMSLDGIQYVSEPSGNDCDGCAFENNEKMCCQAEDCSSDKEQGISAVIWKLKG